MDAMIAPTETPRPTRIHVNLGALRRNFRTIQNHCERAALMPIVKANGYGHGLQATARVFQEEGAAALGVGFLEEGVALRDAGISIPILVLGGIPTEQIPHFLDYDLDMTASSIDKLRAMESAAQSARKRARAHLKIDTGLERIGIHWYNANQLLNAALDCDWVETVGIYSHFAMSAPEDAATTSLQLDRFLEATRERLDAFKKRPRLHIANSAGLLLDKRAQLDMTRPGLALYGVLPDQRLADRLPLEPALTLRSEVVYFKVIPKDAGVSYGWRWRSPQQTRVVTVPVGYGDGYPRALTNRSYALIRGQRYPNVGAICMDQFMTDIGDGEAFNGDEVILIGGQGAESIRVEDLADAIDTTPHEILVGLNQRIPRTYSDE